MIERHRGDDGNIRLVAIDRIQPPAQPDFENGRLDPASAKTSQAASVPNSK
jgi:hypothetical protein